LAQSTITSFSVEGAPNRRNFYALGARDIEKEVERLYSKGPVAAREITKFILNTTPYGMPLGFLIDPLAAGTKRELIEQLEKRRESGDKKAHEALKRLGR